MLMVVGVCYHLEWSVCHEPWSQSAQHHDPNIKHIPSSPDKNHFSLSPDGWINHNALAVKIA